MMRRRRERKRTALFNTSTRHMNMLAGKGGENLVTHVNNRRARLCRSDRRGSLRSLLGRRLNLLRRISNVSSS